jgi:3-mercaptopyruvate sulfurtransferase SseA
VQPLSVGRTTTDINKLLALYDEGHIEGAQAVQIIGDYEKQTRNPNMQR